MFRQMVTSVTGAVNLFRQHPSVLVSALELAWSDRAFASAQTVALGHPANRSNLGPLPQISAIATPLRITTQPTGTLGQQQRRILWYHLIYAYMIENTRIYEVFRRVLQDYLHGEKLGVPLADAQFWLRSTEELFYHDPPPFSIISVSSHIRPDLRASRRNAYQRMFGMDLNHGTDDKQPYPYIRADAANNSFVATLEEFLREVWVGITNARNLVGVDATDRGKIAALARNLFDMLTTRRLNGNLSREEFAFVSMMSWFHLSVDFDSPVVVSLRAEGSSADQRLLKIAERVGLPAHGLCKSYFEIADQISWLLILIETGIFNDESRVSQLFTGQNLQRTMNNIITHWSIITGRDLKGRALAAPAAFAPAVTGNGDADGYAARAPARAIAVPAGRA